MGCYGKKQNCLQIYGYVFGCDLLVFFLNSPIVLLPCFSLFIFFCRWKQRTKVLCSSVCQRGRKRVVALQRGERSTSFFPPLEWYFKNKYGAGDVIHHIKQEAKTKQKNLCSWKSHGFNRMFFFLFSFHVADGNLKKSQLWEQGCGVFKCTTSKKKALNDALLSGKSANASIRLSGCVWGRSHTGFPVQESGWVIQQNESPNSPQISLDWS